MKFIMKWVFDQLVSGSPFSSSPLTRAAANGFFTKKNQHVLLGTKEPENDTSANIHHHSSCQITGCTDPLCKIEQIRHTFSTILTKTGLLHGPLVSKVLYRLQLAALLCNSEANSNSNHEINCSTENKEFSIRILFIGRTGVGKSATINSIFDEPRAGTHAFLPGTDHIHEITGTLNGVILKIIDMPGLLLPSAENTKKNREILLSLRRFLKRSSPDVVLYFERLEFVSCSGYDDSQLFCMITDVFGRDFWFNTLLVMTHSYSYFPELPYYNVDYYLSRCVEKVQRCIHRAVSDTLLENQILFVENRPLFDFEKLLPDVYRDWRSRFLQLCMCTKALVDATAVLGIRNSFKIPPSLRLSDLFSSVLDSGRLSLFADEDGDPYHSNENEIPEPRENPEPIPLPEMTMPPVFDPESHAYRYRGVSTTTDVTTRPILDPHSWDHEPGFDGFKMETASAKFCAGFEAESVRGEPIYTVNSGLCYPTFVTCNRVGCCVSVTNFRDKFYHGWRVEDVLSIGKRLKVVFGGGGVRCFGGESLHGGSITGVITGRNHTNSVLVSVKRVGTLLSYLVRFDFRPVRNAAVSVQSEVGGGKKTVSVRVATSEHVEIAIVTSFFVLRCLLKKIRRKDDV